MIFDMAFYLFMILFESKIIRLDTTLTHFFFAALQELQFPRLHLKVLTYFTTSVVQRQIMSLISELHQ